MVDPGAQFEGNSCAAGANKEHANNSARGGTATASWVIFSTATVGAVEENEIVRYHPY